MIGMYCRAHHDTSGAELCDDCRTLHEYAMVRIDKCPFCPEKPTCANCPVHCYRPDPREHMRTVMRYSGPHMLLRHPYLAVMHVLDGRRRVERPGRRSRS